MIINKYRKMDFSVNWLGIHWEWVFDWLRSQWNWLGFNEDKVDCQWNWLGSQSNSEFYVPNPSQLTEKCFKCIGKWLRFQWLLNAS